MATREEIFSFNITSTTTKNSSYGRRPSLKFCWLLANNYLVEMQEGEGVTATAGGVGKEVCCCRNKQQEEACGSVNS